MNLSNSITAQVSSQSDVTIFQHEQYQEKFQEILTKDGVKYFVDDALKSMKEDLKVESKKKEKGQEDRIKELIDTHLQVKGLIEMPGSGIKDSLKPYDERARFRTLPDYIRHIESEVKGDLRDLEQKAIEQSKTFQQEQEKL